MQLLAQYGEEDNCCEHNVSSIHVEIRINFLKAYLWSVMLHGCKNVDWWKVKDLVQDQVNKIHFFIFMFIKTDMSCYLVISCYLIMLLIVIAFCLQFSFFVRLLFIPLLSSNHRLTDGILWISGKRASGSPASASKLIT